jgi:hypothetical protein
MELNKIAVYLLNCVYVLDVDQTTPSALLTFHLAVVGRIFSQSRRSNRKLLQNICSFQAKQFAGTMSGLKLSTCFELAERIIMQYSFVWLHQLL